MKAEYNYIYNILGDRLFIVDISAHAISDGICEISDVLINSDRSNRGRHTIVSPKSLFRNWSIEKVRIIYTFYKFTFGG
jgi:hypothetical protein